MGIDWTGKAQQLLDWIVAFFNRIVTIPSTDDIKIPLWLAITLLGIIIGLVAAGFNYLNKH